MPTCAVKQPMTRAVSGVRSHPQASIATAGATRTIAATSSAPAAATRAASRTPSGTSRSSGSGTRGSARSLRHHSHATIHGDRT